LHNPFSIAWDAQPIKRRHHGGEIPAKQNRDSRIGCIEKTVHLVVPGSGLNNTTQAPTIPSATSRRKGGWDIKTDPKTTARKKDWAARQTAIDHAGVFVQAALFFGACR